MRGEGRKKEDWKKINNMKGREREAGTERRENKREIEFSSTIPFAVTGCIVKFYKFNP